VKDCPADLFLLTIRRVDIEHLTGLFTIPVVLTLTLNGFRGAEHGYPGRAISGPPVSDGTATMLRREPAGVMIRPRRAERESDAHLGR
jgi:hypothetical protein